jgi:heme exporter protein D
MAEYLAMGGYAAFVWPAYAISAIAIGAAIVLTLSAYRRAKSMLAQLDDGGTT